MILKKQIKRIADLFCGAGGTSTGALMAASELGHESELLAVNHWPTAIDTHSLNHPTVRHICESLDNIRPREAVGGRGHLHLLAASPECTHHSIAAAGRPKNDQSRATAWHVCRWAADLTVENIMIENVPEFRSWGPLNSKGLPAKSRRGETFHAFINALRSMGYNVEWRVVNSADYGDPQSRRRLIIMARRGKPIVWPSQTHAAAKECSHDLFRGALLPHRTARRDVIDWGLKGKSIFRRERSLAPKTMKRIEAGLKKFGGVHAEPFLVMLYGTNDARSVDRPLPSVTANGGHIALAEPFIIHATHGGERRPISVDEPLPTVTGAHNGEMALIEPFIIAMEHGGRERSIDRPLPTITTVRGGAMALCEPFIIKYYGNETGAESIDAPLSTVTTKDRFMLIEPKTGRTVAELDILFRMLQPHELAAAMSFPKWYKFTGNKCQQVKQIGNAVPVNLARAHAKALLSN